MSEENITPSSTTDESFYPEVILSYDGKHELKFKGHFYLKQNTVSFLHKNIVNLYITYELDAGSKDLSTDFSLGSFLFGLVKITKNADPDNYKYSS